MALSDEEETAIRELAEIEGRSVEDVKREMLRARLGLSGTAPREPTSAALARTPSIGDASGASLARTRQEAVQRHQSQSFPGSPVVRYNGDHGGETAEEAEERWLEEEADLLDGVHGLGGQTAGGIFGDAPIATNIYDPGAMSRADSRMGQMAGIKMLGILDRIEQRLGPAPDERPRAALPARRSPRRLGRGDR